MQDIVDKLKKRNNQLQILLIATKIDMIKVHQEIRFFSILSTTTKKRIAKFLDFSLFIDIENFLFENWILKLYNKLTLNKNYFEIDIIKTIYAIKRIADTIAKHINVYRIKDFVYFTT